MTTIYKLMYGPAYAASVSYDGKEYQVVRDDGKFERQYPAADVKLLTINMGQFACMMSDWNIAHSCAGTIFANSPGEFGLYMNGFKEYAIRIVREHKEKTEFSLAKK